MEKGGLDLVTAPARFGGGRNESGWNEPTMARRKATRGVRRGRRKFSRLKLGLLLGLLSILVLVVATGIAYYQAPEKPQSVGEALTAGKNLVEDAKDYLPDLRPAAQPGDLFVVRVLRVVDGDTLVVKYGNKEERVRLLRVDTPESVHQDVLRNTPMGRKASDFTRGRLEGEQVRLECPPLETHDRFGRRLAYIIQNGQNFNVELVREGYSPYYTKYGKSERYDADFRRAEREAQSNKRGVWASGQELIGSR